VGIVLESHTSWNVHCSHVGGAEGPWGNCRRARCVACLSYHAKGGTRCYGWGGLLRLIVSRHLHGERVEDCDR